MEDKRYGGRRLRLLAVSTGRLRVGGPRSPPRILPRSRAEAVAIGASHPNRLEHVRALIDYGAALRRANRRADAREPLRLGLDFSHRGGAGVRQIYQKLDIASREELAKELSASVAAAA